MQGLQMKKKICFIYLDEPYNIFHSLSLATELNKSPHIDLEIFATPRNIEFLEKFSSLAHELKRTSVRPHWYVQLPHLMEIKLQFRPSIFIKYRKKLASFDAIVCSLYDDDVLRKYLGTKTPKLIFAGHGVANRAYSYLNKIKAFDYLLLVGEREHKERLQRDQLTHNNHQVTGYLKYEICKSLKSDDSFKESKPTILYNPHWHKDYSSFYQYGFQILDFFENQDEYNLIFAPHQLLTVRNKNLITKLEKYTKSKTIHMDLNSFRLSDMSYTKAADLYLGDSSSQALEFMLHRRRPCIFLRSNFNKHNISEQLHSWEGGMVLDSFTNIKAIINTAFDNFESIYLEKQNQLVSNIFYQEEKMPSKVATQGILEYLELLS